MKGIEHMCRENIKLKNIFLFFSLFIYSYVHTLFGPFLPPDICPLPLAPLPSLPGRTCSALFSNFVEEKT
jgi:hypothetical protein